MVGGGGTGKAKSRIQRQEFTRVPRKEVGHDVGFDLGVDVIEISLN